MLGDINIDLFKSERPCICNFMDTLQFLSFMPLVTKLAKFPVNELNSAPSLLDHIWSNSLVQCSSGIITVDVTDHCPVFFLRVPIDAGATDKVKLTFRTHDSRDMNVFKHRLPGLINKVNFNTDVNTLTNNFISDLNKLYIDCFPLKTNMVTHTRLSKLWLSSAILKSLKTKAHYFKLAKLGIISNDINKRYRNKLNYIIRKAKQTYFRDKFSSCRKDIKLTWKAV